ncbi:hypothetical protein N0V85_001860 [Neurospora sp. IMI 360204]|nr:hypothetical protein N0V85_001860 [Neurospora sp. IMI 360204]
MPITGAGTYQSLYGGEIPVLPPTHETLPLRSPVSATADYRPSTIPIPRSTSVKDHGTRSHRSATLDAASKRPVIKHAPESPVPSSIRSGSPSRPVYRASDEFYTQPASSINRSRSVARAPFSANMDDAEYQRLRERTDRERMEHERLHGSRAADLYRASRPTVLYSNTPRGAPGYDEEAFVEYTRPGELARYDLDHPRRSRRESIDHYYRPAVSVSSDVGRPYDTIDKRLYDPPPSAFGYDKPGRDAISGLYDHNSVRIPAPSEVLSDTAVRRPPALLDSPLPPGSSATTERTSRRAASRPRPISLIQETPSRSAHPDEYYRARDDGYYKDDDVSQRGFGIRPAAKDHEERRRSPREKQYYDERRDPREPRRSDEDLEVVRHRNHDDRDRRDYHKLPPTREYLPVDNREARRDKHVPVNDIPAASAMTVASAINGRDGRGDRDIESPRRRYDEDYERRDPDPHPRTSRHAEDYERRRLDDPEPRRLPPKDDDYDRRRSDVPETYSRVSRNDDDYDRRRADDHEPRPRTGHRDEDYDRRRDDDLEHRKQIDYKDQGHDRRRDDDLDHHKRADYKDQEYDRRRDDEPESHRRTDHRDEDYDRRRVDDLEPHTRTAHRDEDHERRRIDDSEPHPRDGHRDQDYDHSNVDPRDSHKRDSRDEEHHERRREADHPEPRTRPSREEDHYDDQRVDDSEPRIQAGRDDYRRSHESFQMVDLPGGFPSERDERETGDETDAESRGRHRRDTEAKLNGEPASSPPREHSREHSRERDDKDDETHRRPRPSSTFDPNDTAGLEELKAELAAQEAKENASEGDRTPEEHSPERKPSPVEEDSKPSTETDNTATTGNEEDESRGRELVPHGQKQVRVVSPPREKEEKKPIKGILKQPKAQFPEHPDTVREGVSPHKDDKTKQSVPQGAKWTKINRKLVNPEALTLGKERFEVRDDFVIVLRVLDKADIQKYADITAQLREKRRKEYEDEQNGKALVRHERNGSYDRDEEEGKRRRHHRKDREDEYEDDRREYRRHRATDEQDALYDARQPSRSHRRD